MVASDEANASAEITRARVNYAVPGLAEEDVAETPLSQFSKWLAEAQMANVPEPNAMSLATSGPEGPQVRVVLAKDIDEFGVTFFTNLDSVKAQDLAQDSRAAVVFAWLAQHRQVRLRGSVVPLDRDIAAEYFATRARGAQIGAWASPQSEVISSRADLVERIRQIEERFPEDAPVPLPDRWGGYRIKPVAIEFWQGQPSRLHDRIRFQSRQADARLDDASAWKSERLAP